MVGLTLGLDIGSGHLRARMSPVAAFALADLPAGSWIDHDPAALAPGALASWPATGGGAGAFTQSIVGRQPTVATNGWGPRPVVVFDGTSTTNPDQMASDEPLTETAIHLLVALRGSVQNGAATNKVMIEAPRLSDGKLIATYLQRSTNDPDQDNVYWLGLGGSSNATRTGFAPNAGGVILSVLGEGSHGGVLNGADIVKGATQTAGATATVVNLGARSSDATGGASFSLARRLRIDLAQLPGREFQRYTFKLLAGWAAWEYGIAGDPHLDLVAALPAGHPFKTRRPLASDWFAFPITPQKWGNSLGNGCFQQSFAVWDVANKGLDIQNGCIGGTDSSQILSRIQNDQDAQNGTGSGLSQARIREKVHFVSDLRENDSGNGVTQATGRQNIADIMALLEAGQGAAAGAGRIIFWGRWRGNGAPGTDGRLANSDAEMATDIATYPNYVVFDPVSGRRGMGQILAYDARPGGPAEDADAWARGVIPAAYRAGGGDLLHLSTAGYARSAAIERTCALGKRWTI